MNVGTCRHCGAERIATNAFACPVCCGTDPNPGLVNRVNTSLNRLVGLIGGLVFLLLGLLCTVPLALGSENYGMLIYGVMFLFFAVMMLWPRGYR